MELAAFFDLNQFVRGKTGYACGYFAVLIALMAAKLGSKEPSISAAEATKEALNDYARDHGGDNSASNHDGMSLEQLYDDLRSHSLNYRPLHNPSAAQVVAWARSGYAVLLSVPEMSVYDKVLGHCPYTAWTPSGNHIIMLTGAGPQALEGWFRDTASVDSSYTLRTGPRLYDVARMSFVSATVVFLPWQEVPPSDFNPVALQSHPSMLEPTPDELHDWRLSRQDVPFIAEHAIPQSWLRGKRRGLEFGPVMEPERAVYRDGILYMEARFMGAYASWNSHTNSTTWKSAGVPLVI